MLAFMPPEWERARRLCLGATRPQVEQRLMEFVGDEADELFAATLWDISRERGLIIYDERFTQFRWSDEAAEILEDEPRWLKLLDEVAARAVQLEREAAERQAREEL